MIYVNCGCGNKFSKEKEWVNLDFASDSIYVKKHNILQGLPFAGGYVDAIFSSCMLEHFSCDEAVAHIRECHRVLKKGGYIRIVVPDLENECKEYLKMLHLAREDGAYENRYRYILIELIDQMTRKQSGGEMQKYWDSETCDQEYVRERTGYPEGADGKEVKILFGTKLKRKMKLIAGQILKNHSWYKKYQLGEFMMSGEVHRWMYDEYSLRRLLETNGFIKVNRKKYNCSDIQNWAQHGLEGQEEEYKPNSLYMEGIKAE